MRSSTLALTVLLAACSSSRPRHTMHLAAPPVNAPAARTNPLVVTLVVDQFAGWIAAERLALLPEDGGFARLRREGTWYRQARYAHAGTDTAPGHASLYTGLPPRDHGIQGNELPDGRGGRSSFLRDEGARLVTPEGPTDAVGSSIGRIRVPTLADALRARRPNAVIVSVSLKDRGAIFGGGRRPNAVLWYDAGRDTFVTSTPFSDQLPEWARGPGGTEALRALRASPWTPLDPEWVRAHAATPDDQPGEGDLEGWGTTFPHDFTRARRVGGAFRASPMGDEAVLALGLAAVEHARNPREPMLLALSLSSNDYVGHLFGPDSWEAWDELRRLDAALGRFFSRLDALAGEGGWSLVLSGDHGATTLPEACSVPAARPWCARPDVPDPWQRPCGPPGRVDPDTLGPELQAAAVRVLGPGSWVMGVADPFVYLTPAAEALPADRSQRLLETLQATLQGHPEVARVVDARAVPDRCEEGDSLEALVCQSIPARSGAVFYVQLRAGAFFDSGYVPGRGTSHGAPYLYDRAVPLLVRSPGLEPAGRVEEAPVPFTRFRETAARLLGL